MTSACTGATGRMSWKASTWALSWMICAGVVPATMLQKRQPGMGRERSAFTGARRGRRYPMCGRTALTASPEDLRDAFGLDDLPEIDAALQRAAVAPAWRSCGSDARAPDASSRRCAGAWFRWAKDAKIGQQARARAGRDGREHGRLPRRVSLAAVPRRGRRFLRVATPREGRRARRSSCGAPTAVRSRSPASGAAGTRPTAR